MKGAVGRPTGMSGTSEDKSRAFPEDIVVTEVDKVRKLEMVKVEM